MKFYKGDVILFLVTAFLINVGAVLFVLNFHMDSYACIFLAMGFLLSLLIALLPLITYRQWTYAMFGEGRCTSYTVFNKKLCEIDTSKSVYYEFFDVHFRGIPPVRFAAISNEPFSVNPRGKSIFASAKFYGTYDRSKIVIFIYDKQSRNLVDLDNWIMTD